MVSVQRPVSASGNFERVTFEPVLITQVAALLHDNLDAQMASLYHSIDDPAEVADPNVVKVVCDARGRALYFSRAPIPWDRDGRGSKAAAGQGASPWRRHIGLYAYRAGFPRRYVAWHGAVIAMAEASAQAGPGVDTPDDLARVRALMGGGRPMS